MLRFALPKRGIIWLRAAILKILSSLKYQLKRLASSLNLGYAVPLSLEEKIWRREHDSAWMIVALPLAELHGSVEEVLVEQLDAERYRIVSSPAMLEGLAADDVIALDAHSLTGCTLLQRGNNVCIHVFCDAAKRNRIETELKQTLGRIGGRLDGLMGQTGLCFTVPVAAGFPHLPPVRWANRCGDMAKGSA